MSIYLDGVEQGTSGVALGSGGAAAYDSLGDPVQDLAALRAVLQADRTDKQARFVEDELGLYAFDEQGTVGGETPTDVDDGRWYQVSGPTHSHPSLIGDFYVDGSATAPSGNTYTTIQAAIVAANAAFTATPINVHVAPGIYSEDVDVLANVRLIGMGDALNIGGVIIVTTAAGLQATPVVKVRQGAGLRNVMVTSYTSGTGAAVLVEVEEGATCKDVTVKSVGLSIGVAFDCVAAGTGSRELVNCYASGSSTAASRAVRVATASSVVLREFTTGGGFVGGTIEAVGTGTVNILNAIVTHDAGSAPFVGTGNVVIQGPLYAPKTDGGSVDFDALSVTVSGSGASSFAQTPHAAPAYDYEVANKKYVNDSIEFRVYTTHTTAAPTAVDTDRFIFMDAAAQNQVLALPSAVGTGGMKLTIKRTDTDATKTVTIDPNGAETIEGNATQAVLVGESIEIVSDNVEWWIV